MATSLRGVDISEERIKEIKDVADGWGMANGIAMKASHKEEDFHKFVLAPYALFPSILPWSILHQAKSSMIHFSSLMHKVSMDQEFMEEALRNVVEGDEFMQRLWHIYKQVNAQGVKQPLHLGLFRNDFMLNVRGAGRNDPNLTSDDLELKQIEFNAIASGFAGITQPMANMHRLTLSLAGKEYLSEQLPVNTPATGMSTGLVKAWELYGSQKAIIIFIVNDSELNVIDQKGLELEVYRQNPKIRILYRTLMDIGTRGKLDDNDVLTLDGEEIAVIYFRFGYTSTNYTSEKMWDARLMMESSRAIKCPSIHHQLVGAKKIQQVLAKPGCLERFIKDPAIVRVLRETFAGLYSLDLGPEGDKTVEMALADPDKFVLKPQREGGGNNLYGADITRFLEEHRNSPERNAWIIMERIFPWEQKNYLVKNGVPFQLSDVISEIGVYGVLIGSMDGEAVTNYECGHMLRTKILGVDEGGICAGFAVLDTPLLV